MKFKCKTAIVMFSVCAMSLMLLCRPRIAVAGPPGDESAPAQVPLVVPAGVPLRLYLTKRVPKKNGAPVEAKLLDPVYVFDHEVIPAGATVLGRVAQVHSVPKSQRARAMVGGDFTPLRTAAIEFTTLAMPSGLQMPLHTSASLGLGTLVTAQAAKTLSSNPPKDTGVLGSAKRKVSDAIHGQIALVKSIPSTVRAPGKKEKVEEYLVDKLPYHPQYVRRGSRFDAELAEPLSFGSEPLARGSLASLGTQPPAGAVAHARLLTQLDSASAQQGDGVQAVLTEPVYSADHKLILPEGVELEGTVLQVKKARRFRRGGQLRFSFHDVQFSPELARLQEATTPVQTAHVQEGLKFRTESTLQGAESAGKSSLKLDNEGGFQAQEPKTRFLAAAAAVMVAGRSGDLDAERNQSGQVIGQRQNIGGRTIGGGFGFGLLGAAIAQSSRYVGAAFGYYGMTWALYSTLIARGSEVQFAKDNIVEIRFGSSSATAPAHAAH